MIKDNRLELYNQGLNDKQIGDIVNQHRHNIGHWRRSHGLPRNIKINKIMTKELKDKCLNFYKLGLIDIEISRKLNIPYGSVRNWRVCAKLEKNTVERICNICNKSYKTLNANQKYCRGCSSGCKNYRVDTYQQNKSIEIYAKKIQEDFKDLCITNIEEAKRIAKEMEIAEGKEFKELAIDGILDKQYFKSTTIHNEIIPILNCPICQNNIDVIRNGFRMTKTGKVQRFRCIKCNHKFVDKTDLPGTKYQSEIIKVTLDLHSKGLSYNLIRKYLKQFYDTTVNRSTPKRWIDRYEYNPTIDKIQIKEKT